MGNRTSHLPGTFSWVDLATTDASAAKAFYGDLFGWDADDADTGDGTLSTTFRLEGAAVAGLSTGPEGLPPSWTSYVTVDDAGTTAGRAADLGGTVEQPAFDVRDAGRMAVLADPQAAVLAIWEPRAMIGAERVNDIGCLCMNELATGDLDGARDFYRTLFGWTTEAVDTGPDGPRMESVFNQGTLNATLTADDQTPPHWRPYFTVASTAATLDQIADLSGSTVVGPIPIPDGSIAIVCDPQGAEFALFEGEVDP